MTKLKTETKYSKHTINISDDLLQKMKKHLSHLLTLSAQVNHCIFYTLQQFEGQEAAQNSDSSEN